MLKRYKKFLESSKTEFELMLRDISFGLEDDYNLYVEEFDSSDSSANFLIRQLIFSTPRGKDDPIVFLRITDRDKIYCKNYPENDMDWLFGKDVINNFISQELDRLNLVNDEDYYIYGGGLSVTFAFTKKAINRF
jgi:hypothetical protein